jgi:CubicO group peptidase (beta-lactamase class C family)
MKGESRFSLGFMKPSAAWLFGSPAAFRAPGAGGALGFADPQTGIGYAYVTNRMGTHITGDPWEVALREAVATCVEPAPHWSARSPSEARVGLRPTPGPSRKRA